jgi:hypothetical protein
MKTKKGIAVTFLGKGLCLRCDWYDDGRNILIPAKFYTAEKLFTIVENLRKIKHGKPVANIWEPQ